MWNPQCVAILRGKGEKYNDKTNKYNESHPTNQRC